jgi:hypothetical protein
MNIDGKRKTAGVQSARPESAYPVMPPHRPEGGANHKLQLKEIVMLKRNILAAAVLAAQVVVANAQPAQSEIYEAPEQFYADNPVPDPAPTPPSLKQREIWKDPAVFYAENPVADPLPTPADIKRAEIWKDPTVFYSGNPYKDSGRAGVRSASAQPHQFPDKSGPY